MPEVKLKPHLHASYIDVRAYDIVERLKRKGFQVFLVGGCVRDLLLSIEPKDFDIATNATPLEIKKSIPGSYIIGKRFKLVLAKRGPDQFEIATFRREATAQERGQDLESETDEVSFITNDNFFGTAEQDALRRDFTINALFYDPINHDLVDYVKGVEDLNSRIIKMIGDPERRIIEDPIRSLRAIRLCHKIGFTLEPNLRGAILEQCLPVGLSALPRRREEYLKILQLPRPSLAFFEMYDLGLIHSCLPSLKSLFESSEGRFYLRFYLDVYREFTQTQSLEAHHLMIPLVLALTHIHTNRDWDNIELFLKNEFGAFKNEISFLYQIIWGAKSFPRIEHFRRRSKKRKSNFLKAPWFDDQFDILCFEKSFSGHELMLWEKEYDFFMRHGTYLDDSEPADQSPQDPESD